MTIAAEKLSYRYGALTALESVTAAAAAGRVTALLGPNAAGKSTLLRCMVGALKPAAGRVVIDGDAAHRLGTRRLAERVAYVPQRPQVAAAFSVRDVVELGRFALPANRRRVEAALEELGLGDVAERPFPALSVGQQQRATLARALAQLAPDGHLLLDEPTSAMDLRHELDCMRLLRRLAGAGATVIVAMHDLTLAAEVADDCWLLDGGALVASGPAGEVMALSRLRSVFGVEFEWLPRPGGAPVLVTAAGAAG